ncbi:large ribosomal subunit protein uL30m-like [Diadema antillarum]|uniref:large ribosomal subunit protein uL30m-like n=1 Tax=Diadema antillarum TaxID=105358 RepID=UPI003A88860E
MNAASLCPVTFRRLLQVSCACVRQYVPVARSLSSHPHPTNPEEGQEETDPHLLHAVWRIRSLKGRPYWERRIMKQLRLEDTRKPVIHKNTPLVNELLTKVRHLVRIKPVNPVYGLPDGDYEETLLKWNGEFVVKRKIEPLEARKAELSDGKDV